MNYVKLSVVLLAVLLSYTLSITYAFQHFFSAKQSISAGLVIEHSSHDVAVTEILTGRNIVGKGFCLSVNVKVVNYGIFVENSNLTVFSNGIPVQVERIDIPLGSTAFILTWNTTGFDYGNYTLSAFLEPIQEEVDTKDNALEGGTVYVGIPGDVTPAYGIVDMKDVSTVVKAFGSIPRHLRWNPNANINGDNIVDMKDIGIVVKHFGETYQPY